MSNWNVNSALFSIENQNIAIECNPNGGTFPAISLMAKHSHLRVVVSKTPGPMCHLGILVPTLSPNDKGLPHTLEHLIFCGSKNFPFRGFLDAKASINLSQGTNAYTAPDHTLYTLETAGETGLFNTLPAFLDGVLNPVLTDDQFITEVYHYDETGKEGGVVYSEMSSLENTEWELIDVEMRRELYGEKSPYSKNFGGLTKALAELENSEIIKYHTDYYRSERVTVVIVGAVNMDLTSLLKVFEDNISIFHSKPLIETNSSLKPESCSLSLPLTIKQIPFPSDDKEIGSISFGWNGPSLQDSKTKAALSVLCQFLSETSSSPLNQKFVEKSNPMANSIDIEIRSYEPTCIIMTFSGVPYEEDSGSTSKYFEGSYFYNELRSELAAASGSAFSNTPYTIQDTLNRFLLEITSHMESNPIEEVNNLLVSYILCKEYSPAVCSSQSEASMFSNDNLAEVYKQFSVVKQLLSEPLSYWQNLLNEWLTNSNCVMVKMVPDTKLGAKLEENSLEKQRSRITGLQEHEVASIKSRIGNAVNNNKVNIPEDIIRGMSSIPDTSNIPKLTYSQKLYTLIQDAELSPSTVTQDIKNGDISSCYNLPFELVSVIETETSFFHLKLDFPILSLPSKLKPFLPLFQSMIFSSDILLPSNIEVDTKTRKSCSSTNASAYGNRVDYKIVTTKLSELLVSHGLLVGSSSEGFLCYPPTDLLMLYAKIDPKKFKEAIKWYFLSIIFMDITPIRILSVAKNMLSQLLESKRNGDFLLNSMVTRLTTSPQAINELRANKDGGTKDFNYDSIEIAISIFKQESFLKSIISSTEDFIKAKKLAKKSSKPEPDPLVGDSKAMEAQSEEGSEYKSDSDSDSDSGSDSSVGPASESESESESESGYQPISVKIEAAGQINLAAAESGEVGGSRPLVEESSVNISNDVLGRSFKKHKAKASQTNYKNLECAANSGDCHEPEEIFDVLSILGLLESIKKYIIDLASDDIGKILGFVQLGTPKNPENSNIDCINIIVTKWSELCVAYKNHHEPRDSNGTKNEEMRSVCFKTEQVGLDVNSTSPFFSGVNYKSKYQKPFPFPFVSEFPEISAEVAKETNNTFIVAAPSLGSSFSSTVVNCSTVVADIVVNSVAKPTVDELEEASIRILSELLSRTDGILYNAVRGNGYAYGAYVSYSQLRKRIFLTCHDAADINGAIRASNEVLERLRDDIGFWEKSISEFEVSVAKSSLVFSDFSRVSTPSSILSLCLAAYIRGFADADAYNSFNNTLLSLVTVESLRHVFLKHFIKLVGDDKDTITIVVTPSAEAKEPSTNSNDKSRSDTKAKFSEIKLTELGLK